jgi:hypothetical protein
MSNKNQRAPKTNKPKLSIKEKKAAKKAKKAATNGGSFVAPKPAG